VQRILPRGEIESLDHTRIPRLRLPQRAWVFADRAARLRQLAESSPVAGYLQLMAHLAEAQQRALKDFTPPPPDPQRIERARTHGMPPLQPADAPRGPEWRALLARLLDEIGDAPDTPTAAVEVCSALRHALRASPQAVEDLADALLAGRTQGVDGAAAPFVMAALQVYWTGMAAAFDEGRVPAAAGAGVCPLCGTPPVASVIRIGGAYDGYRYLCCPLCSSEWHLVRVTCSHCAQTQGIAYHLIEGGSEAIKAESCDGCRTYRKIFYQEKDPHVEPVADDLASVALDVLMGEAGYARSSGNPLLWQGDGD
jgi:FdhE protein